MVDDATLSPDEAFAALGNETRVAILRALGDAGGPLSFSDLYDRVDVDDTGQFNYHLDKLESHFVRHTGAGYELARPGSRVVEAVLSGAVTDAPVLERTAVDHPCPFCGAPVEVTFRDERVELYCTECEGNYGSGGTDPAEDRYGYLGFHPLPPAGVEGRDPPAILRAAVTWGRLELLAAGGGVCPRCSAALDRSLRACEDHDATDGLCDACGNRHAVVVDLACTNCIYAQSGSAIVGIAAATPLLAFLTARGFNPVTPDPTDQALVSRVLNDYEEAILSTDPLRVRLTVALDGDELDLVVDETLTVVETVERSGTAAD